MRDNYKNYKMFEIQQLKFEDQDLCKGDAYPTDAKYYGRELIRYGLYLKNNDNKKEVFYIKGTSMKHV
jgi:hypothetical protein